jgi:ribonucleoside-diphosphate reductase alpha chain
MLRAWNPYEKRWMLPAKIYKRDGRLVAFEPEKISVAMHKAFAELKIDDSKVLRGLTAKAVSEIDRKFSGKFPHVEDVQDIVEQTLIRSGYERTASAYIDYRRKHAGMRDAKRLIGVETDELKLSVNAISVLEKRYLLKNDQGRVIESPQQMFRRVAREIARIEARYGKTDAKVMEDSFCMMMSNLDFLPNSPTLMNAGTRMGQLSACFVLPVDDSIEGIFDSLKHMAVIHQSGGGTGFSFSRLRPKGDLVSSTKCPASGPVSFMRVYDTATDVIKQGGRRRGANMGVLRVDHPDIMEFIAAKKDPSVFNNFNISVAVTDSFMHAAEKGGSYDLKNPRTGLFAGSMEAKDVLRLIATMAWHNGDPGVIFIDEMERHNPTPDLGKIESTNPCVTADTWIMTGCGPRRVNELVGNKFIAVINGKKFFSSDRGFFPTGIKQVIKIRTKEGLEIRLTANHLVRKVREMTRYKLTTEWIKAGSLKKNDLVVLNNHRSFEGWKGKYDEREGYLVGLLLGDGTMNKDKTILSSWGETEGVRSLRTLAYSYATAMPHRTDFKGWVKVKGRQEYRMATGYLKKIAEMLGLKPGEKVFTESIEKESSAFCRGLLRGFFDSDGSVQGNQSKGVSVRLAQSNIATLKTMQRMLLRFGIFSAIYARRKERVTMLPDGKGGKKGYACAPQYELVISRENLRIFYEEIGFGDSDKRVKLESALKSYKRTPYKRPFFATVDSVEVENEEEVFDVIIPGINAFDANGFYVHNCGEQPLLPYESCNLGSINLAKFVEKGKVDWTRLEKTVRLATRFLDNVIDANNFPLDRIEDVTKANRKIGLGVMGFADMLIRLNIAYNSESAVRLAEKVMGFIKEKATEESVRLANERGSFPNFQKSSLAKRFRAIRNASITTVAPTGTISIIAGCSSGIEPIFGVSFVRNVMGGTELLETNQDFEVIAKENGFYSNNLIMDIAKQGSVQKMSSIPKAIRSLFVTALDIAPEWHIRMQAAFQKHTDSAVSKTINFPSSATIGDFEKAFRLAYRLKCKGITAYRFGTREGQVLSFGNDAEKKKGYMSVPSEFAGGCPKNECPF